MGRGSGILKEARVWNGVRGFRRGFRSGRGWGLGKGIRISEGVGGSQKGWGIGGSQNMGARAFGHMGVSKYTWGI